MKWTNQIYKIHHFIFPQQLVSSLSIGAPSAAATAAVNASRPSRKRRASTAAEDFSQLAPTPTTESSTNGDQQNEYNGNGNGIGEGGGAGMDGSGMPPAAKKSLSQLDRELLQSKKHIAEVGLGLHFRFLTILFHPSSSSHMELGRMKMKLMLGLGKWNEKGDEENYCKLDYK
jgi:hypothetical protein